MNRQGSLTQSVGNIPRRRLLFLSALAAMASGTAHAQNYFWKGGDGDWDTTTNNWSTSSPGGATTTYVNNRNTFFRLDGGNINLTQNFITPFQGIGGGGVDNLDYVFTSDVVGGVTLDYTGSAPLEFLGTGQQLTIGSGVTARMTNGNDGTFHVRGNGNTLNIYGGTLVRTGGSVLNLNNVTVNVANGGILGGDAQGGNQIYLGRQSAATLNVGTGGIVHIGEASGGTQTRSLIVGVQSGGSGEVTLSGGEINIYNGDASSLKLGDNQGSATTATFNLDGGVLHTRQIIEADSNNVVTSTFNFNGGVIEVSDNNTATTAFMQGIDNAVVKAGGVIVDTNGESVAINQILTHDAALGATADGGLTKQGVGNLTLGGVNTYTGDTVVQGGADAGNLSILTLDEAFLSDLANVTIAEFGVLSLAHTETDTIAGLFLNGVAAATGTWGAIGSGADNETEYLTGTGQLLVTVPEVSSFAAILGGLSLALIVTRRKVRG